MNKEPISIDEQALIRMKEFDYPGNVRELENMIERAIVIGDGKKIRLSDLPLAKDSAISGYESLEDLEKVHISQILNKYGWNISQSAKALKVDRVTLYNKIKKFDLKQPE